jgi:hypothetical protein
MFAYLARFRFSLSLATETLHRRAILPGDSEFRNAFLAGISRYVGRHTGECAFSMDTFQLF